MKIGITGSIACGKSTVSAYLRALGHPVVDADAISRALTAPGGEALPLLRETFGSAVFDGDALNRQALGALVFSSGEARAQLNALLHPLIIARCARELAALDAPDGLVFGDVPLLYECGMERLFDRVWVVCAPRERQIERLRTRDGLSRDQAIARIDAQMPQQEKIARADAVIDTDAAPEQTRLRVNALLGQLRERSHT